MIFSPAGIVKYISVREGLFIKKNIDKWKQYQYETATDPDEMAQEFSELVNDLGYSKTFYPQSKVTVYLNGLASRIYLGIYKNKKEEYSKIGRFCKTELPLTIRRHHRALLYSFLLFMGSVFMGAFSAAHDETFVRGMLGDNYVEMTQENISNGDPFGVYKKESRFPMFLWIAINNIKVSLVVFILGFFLGIGTVRQLFFEGVRLGAFEYFFFARGIGWKSILVVFIHGTLEISALIIAGAAGLILGGGFLFPGTNKRLSSLKRAARDGVKVMVGLIPIFITAAFLEGFVTRYSSMPIGLSILILLSSLFFITWYFVIYPIRLEKRTNAVDLTETP